VATWPAEVGAATEGAGRGKRLLSPLALACQALPNTPHGAGYMWNTSTVRSPCSSALVPAVLSAPSRRSVRTFPTSGVLRWFLLALALTPVLWLLMKVLSGALGFRSYVYVD
jgi:hypothetical protein